MRFSVLILCLFVLGCSSRQSMEDAKAVVKSHEEYVKTGKLEGVVSNMTDDVVGVIPGMPLIKGKNAFRVYYAGSFKSGRTEVTHDIRGVEAEGDVIILHGFAQGTLTFPDTTMVPLSENFLMLFKKQEDGTMKMWRVAFSPGAR